MANEILNINTSSSRILPSQEDIQRRIHNVRGVQVMLDSDLAMLYQVETKHLNRAVKRNANRFPEDFMFKLTKEEWDILRCQNVTSKFNPEDEDQNKTISFASQDIQNKSTHGGARYLPHAFTEEGVGQMFDAFVLVEELIQKAKRRIVLIDDYVNANVLQRFHKRNAGVTLDCYVKSRFATQDLQDAITNYNTQYPTEVTTLHTFECSHDRWLIIDDTVYHFGASIKDLGKRWFSVDIITEQTADDLISRL